MGLGDISVGFRAFAYRCLTGISFVDKMPIVHIDDHVGDLGPVEEIYAPEEGFSDA